MPWEMIKNRFNVKICVVYVIYPPLEYGFPQPRGLQQMVLASQPHHTPFHIKWAPMPQHTLGGQDGIPMSSRPIHLTQDQPPSLTLEEAQLFLSQEVQDYNMSRTSSFASDYDPEPPIRTGLMSHPNPRSGREDGFCI
jgi:hypothetical protein